MVEQLPYRPCRGWAFLSEYTDNSGIIRDVGIDEDKDRINNYVEFKSDYKPPIEIKAFGMIAISLTWITKEEER